MALRRDSGRPPRRMLWDGTPERAREIDTWARDSALLPRWQWTPDGGEARVLVQRPYPDSAEWVVTPAGSVIRRIEPPKDEKMEEADWPLEVSPPPEA